MKDFNKKGFTLIELLAVISILAIVSVIVMYTSVNVIGAAKSKSYLTSVRNVEKIAESFITENNDDVVWKDNSVDNNLEYSCVTVKDLIEAGYFDSDVLKSMISDNRNLSEEDYVYIERNKNNKTITKNTLLVDTSDSLMASCIVNKNNAKIEFSISPSGWSKEKEVTINYELVRYESLYDEYLYYSDYNNEIIEKNNFSSSKEQVITTINKNGVLFAEIKKDDLLLVQKRLSITKIDNIKPIVELGNYDGDMEVIENVVVPIHLIDNESGIKDNSFTRDDIIVKIGDVEISDRISLDKIDTNNYNISISNNLNYGVLQLIIKKDGVFDNADNGNEEIILDTGIVFEEPKIVNITYDFNGGWMKQISNSYTTSGEYIYTVPSDGEYQLEVWGAQGGTGMTDGALNKEGGYGGYSSGVISLKSGVNLYVNVGGKGEDAKDQKAGSAGGYNGGGKGGNDSNYTSSGGNEPGAGGGGATHIATKSGLLSTLSSNTDALLIAAGGGGGGSYFAKGGSGGGIEGNKGVNTGASTSASVAGGTQTSGFKFGLGGTASNSFNSGGGGGGAGYYGGKGGTGATGVSGAGGSGYIGNSLLTNKYMYCYDCKSSYSEKTYLTNNVSDTPISNYAKSGNGAAVLSLLSKENIKKEYEPNTKYGEMPKLLRTDYVFVGWNTKADGTGTYVTASSQLVSNKDHTLYAIWSLCGVPKFEYTGSYEIVDDNDNLVNLDLSCSNNWKIRFLTDGTLTMKELRGASSGIDIFLVAGGGKGGTGSKYIATSSRGGGGGGGGSSITVTKFPIKNNINYSLDIGDAGENTVFKKVSTAYYTALAGSNGYTPNYINNSGWTSGIGSGGAGRSSKETLLFGALSIQVNRGSAGGNGGYLSSGKAGVYEFNGTSGKRYGAGGGAGGGADSTNIADGSSDGSIGGADGGGKGGRGCDYHNGDAKSGSNGVANTGSGGGGGGGACGHDNVTSSSPKSGATGGSGIIIIRNTRTS